MAQVGFASAKMSGQGSVINPDPIPLSNRSKIGQLVEYANHVGIVELIDQDRIKINTQFVSKCQSECKCNKTKIYDSIEWGKQIIID